MGRLEEIGVIATVLIAFLFCANCLSSAGVTAPNVVGLTQGQASSVFDNAGVALGAVTRQASATVTAGLIVSQYPAAGTGASQGAPVSLVISSGPQSGEGGDKDAFMPVPGQRQLFLDNAAISELSGLAQTMHAPEKRGAVLKPDIPSDGNLVQVRGEPLWVPEAAEYRLLYYAYARDPKLTVGMALATSKDGLHWTKPILGAMEVNGSRENNWIPVEEGVAWPNNAIEGIVYDPDDPDPARRFKGLAGAVNRHPIISPDAIHWQRLGTEEIVSGDESHLLYDRPKRRFAAIVKTSNQYGRAFAIATSTDFEHWTPIRFLFGADAEDQMDAPPVIRRRLQDPAMLGPLFVDPDPASGTGPSGSGKLQPAWRAEVYNIGVFPYEGRYLGLPSMYYPTGTSLPDRNNTDGFHVIQLAVSRTLDTWTRLGERRAFIPPSGIASGRAGVFDRVQLLAANAPVAKDGELWFYYSGLKWRDSFYDLNRDGTPRDPATLTEEERADMKEGCGAVCLAVLRRDGFVSLDAAGAGHMLTKPFQISGDTVFLNLAAPNGHAEVELLGDLGQPIPGFARGDAIPITGDGVRLPVTWKNGASIAAISRENVRLKIYLTAASLYAFWTE